MTKREYSLKLIILIYRGKSYETQTFSEVGTSFNAVNILTRLVLE
jgi:hypothetical protein